MACIVVTDHLDTCSSHCICNIIGEMSLFHVFHDVIRTYTKVFVMVYECYCYDRYYDEVTFSDHIVGYLLSLEKEDSKLFLIFHQIFLHYVAFLLCEDFT